MGEPKPLLLWKGIPLVRFVSQILREGGAYRVSVVVADPRVAETVGAAAIWNPSPERGMLSSVQCGLNALAPGDAFLVCPCDLPLLRAEQVRQVCDAWDGGPSTIVVPVFGGKRGHPTLFGPENAQRIRSMDPESEGLNALVRRQTGIVTVEVAARGPVTDADTPAQWAELVGREGIDDAVE